MKPPPADEPELLISDLSSSAIRPHPPRELRPLLNGLSIVLVVALIAAGALWLRGRAVRVSSSSAVNVAGWHDVGLQNIASLAFSPSAPATGYACQKQAAQASDQFSGPLTLRMTHDGGTIWQASATPFIGRNCAISIDPIDAQDIILLTTDCSGTCDVVVVTPRNTVARSYDGGKHWQSLTIPYDGKSPSSAYSFGSVAWLHGTVFITAHTISPIVPFATYIAALLAHGSATWLDGNSLTQATPPDFQLVNLFSFQESLIVELRQGSGNPCPSCDVFLRSVNAGQSWQQVTATRYQGQPITIMGSTADGHTLLGEIGTDIAAQQLLRSTNGVDWQLLPPLPPRQLHDSVQWQTPDGTVYTIMLDSTTSPSLFVLPPKASAWRRIDYLPLNGYLLAISTNAQGKPVALWGLSSRNTALPITELQRHAP